MKSIEEKNKVSEIRKVANMAFTCLGYEFVKRDEFIDNYIEHYNTEEKMVKQIVYGYARNNNYIKVKNGKIIFDGCSKKTLELLKDKILESKNDLSIFVKWLSKFNPTTQTTQQ